MGTGPAVVSYRISSIIDNQVSLTGPQPVGDGAMTTPLYLAGTVVVILEGTVSSRASR